MFPGGTDLKTLTIPVVLATTILAALPAKPIAPQAQARKQTLSARVNLSEVKSINDTLADAADIEEVIAPIRTEIKASFEQPLVNAPKGLYRGRGAEENLLGYWIADAMRIRSAALLGSPVQFAITNRGGIRANLRAGMLKVGDIFEVMPFDNELVVMELTGEEVVQVVREGIFRRDGEPCSGVKTRVEGTSEKPIITVTWEDGSPIDPKAIVKVATTDYLFNGGDSIPTLKKGRRPFTTGLPLRQVLLDLCLDRARQKLDLLPPESGRYLFSPDIAKAITERRGLGR